MTNEEFLNDACAHLMEHFDSVRIFATKHDGNSEMTIPYTTGAGNFYAQLGQVNEWKANQNEVAREDARTHGGEEGLETA